MIDRSIKINVLRFYITTVIHLTFLDPFHIHTSTGDSPQFRKAAGEQVVTHLGCLVSEQCLQLNAAVCHFLALIVLRLTWLWHMTQHFSSDVHCEDEDDSFEHWECPRCHNNLKQTSHFYSIYPKLKRNKWWKKFEPMQLCCMFSFELLNYKNHMQILVEGEVAELGIRQDRLIHTNELQWQIKH